MKTLLFEEATRDDLPTLIFLLFDDEGGAKREIVTDPVLPSYARAFDAISQDPNAHLIKVTLDNQIVGVAQLNFIANLTFQGGLRAQIEGVRVRSTHRSQGIGKQLFEHLITMATERDCHLIQLSTHQSRPKAYRFYQRLGFVHTHHGFKYPIKENSPYD